ncbi:MAG: universal stress protein [Bryobacteraceae bacterium]
MITPKIIVLPVDFSTLSASAAAHARIMAKQYGATIVALHVMRPFHLAAEGVDVSSAVVLDWYARQKPLLQSQLEEFVNIYLKNCKVKTIFREGDPAAEIVRAANEEKADLIIIATRGYGPFRRFLLGSVAAKVLNDSLIPVLTGAHIEVPAGEAEHIKSIVVAVELDDRAGLLIAAGNSIAKSFDAELHVVHASPDDGAGAAQYMDPAWRVEVARMLKERLEESVKDAAATATVHVIPGEPAEVVRQVAEDVHADLVVLGRHMDKSLLGRLRTHSYAIVREAPCPVLSL